MSRPKKEVVQVRDLDKEDKPSFSPTVVEPTKDEIIEILQPSTRELSRKKLEKLMKEETVNVKGRFRHYETPGASQRFHVRKYANIPPFDKLMTDNEIYEIPLYVARFLNGIDKMAMECGGKINTCAYPEHEFVYDESNNLDQRRDGQVGRQQKTTVGKWTRRFGFESLQFDIDS